MAFLNYSRQEIDLKVVYCGPGLSGKTTNVLQVYRSVKPELRGRLVTLNTEVERTLFFDFLPMDIGKIAGFNLRFHLYTVPGQVFHEASRQEIFRGVDGVVFVADSEISRMDANYESLRDLKLNLENYEIDINHFPYVLQLNKRDLNNIHDRDFLVRELHMKPSPPVYEAVAVQNLGVQETLKDILKQAALMISEEIESRSQVASR